MHFSRLIIDLEESAVAHVLIQKGCRPVLIEFVFILKGCDVIKLKRNKTKIRSFQSQS